MIEVDPTTAGRQGDRRSACDTRARRLLMPVQALLPIVLFAALFIGYCLADLRRSEVQHLPKWAWALVIVLSVPAGGLVYLAMGRRTS
jgi:hypothetical protein